MVRKIENNFEKSNITPLGIRLLTFLARHPTGRFYTKELASDVGASVSGCHTALAGLRMDNLVVREKEGVNVYWWANPDNPALTSFKVFMNIQELGATLRDLEDLAIRVVLFGSCARGDDTQESDVDLLVVTLDVEATRRLLAGRRVAGRPLRPLVMSPVTLVGMSETDPALSEETGRGIVLARRGPDG